MTSSLGEDSLLTLAWRCTQPTMMPFKMLIYCGMLSPPWSRTLRRECRSHSPPLEPRLIWPRGEQWEQLKGSLGSFSTRSRRSIERDTWTGSRLIKDSVSLTAGTLPAGKRDYSIKSKRESTVSSLPTFRLLSWPHTHTHSGTLTQWT